jgi:menaquinone-dependent protoporphyrinogen oxidase
MSEMKVLVTAASRHGATREIAGAIRGILAAAGHEVDLATPERVSTVAGYDAVVLGSAVYAGRWLPQARDLVERELGELLTKQVWLFSSGPVGEPAKPVETPAEATEIGERVHAVEHRVFEGKLDRRALGFAEKAIVTMVGAAEGDFRPWDDVVTWARGIEASLEGASPQAGTREGAAPAWWHENSGPFGVL